MPTLRGGYRAAAVVVDSDRAVIHWVADFLGTDGRRYHMDQVALQTWRGERNGARIVYERFVYDPTTLVAPDADRDGARAARPRGSEHRLV